jgi:hypothetical protein
MQSIGVCNADRRLALTSALLIGAMGMAAAPSSVGAVKKPKVKTPKAPKPTTSTPTQSAKITIPVGAFKDKIITPNYILSADAACDKKGKPYSLSVGIQVTKSASQELADKFPDRVIITTNRHILGNDVTYSANDLILPSGIPDSGAILSSAVFSSNISTNKTELPFTDELNIYDIAQQDLTDAQQRDLVFKIRSTPNNFDEMAAKYSKSKILSIATSGIVVIDCASGYGIDHTYISAIK